MNPVILLVVGALGLVGCLILLILGINMLREERTAKDNGPASEPGAASTMTTTPASRAEPLASTDALTAAADASTGAAVADSTEAVPLYAAPPANPAAMTPLGNAFAGVMAGVMARMPGRGASAARGSAHEVLRVLRDNLTGRVLIELGGQRYTNLGDLSDPTLRQALQTILEDLDSLRGGLNAEPPPSRPEPSSSIGEDSPVATPRASLPAEARASLPSSAPNRLVAGSSTRSAGGEPRPLPRPTMNPFKQLAVLREMSKNPPPPEMTIAEQIDVVLQAHIVGTPLRERGLHMRPGPRGDAVFDLDGEGYTAVDDLPDEAVRAVVRAAIAEWEGKQ